jgi:hypothetical protein
MAEAMRGKLENGSRTFRSDFHSMPLVAMLG